MVAGVAAVAVMLGAWKCLDGNSAEYWPYVLIGATLAGVAVAVTVSASYGFTETGALVVYSVWGVINAVFMARAGRWPTEVPGPR